MSLIQKILSLFGLGEKFKMEEILKGVLVGGKAAGQEGAAGGAATAAEATGFDLGKLRDMFSQHGLGQVFASWVGTGKNMPVSPDQLRGLLGSDQVKSIAQRLGIPPDLVCEKLARYLPGVVDKLTPGGRMPEPQTAPA